MEAFRAGREARSESVRLAEPARASGTTAMMRAVVVGESDAAARRAVVEELVRFRSLAAAEGSRSDRYREAETYFDELLAGEFMISGSPDTVAQSILDLQGSLSIDLFLANVYPMGAEPERVRETLRLLAGPVRERLSTA